MQSSQPSQDPLIPGPSPEETRERAEPGPETPHRAIRSFVLRQGRVTDAQQRALGELLPRFGIAYAGRPLDFEAAFGRVAP